MGVWQRCQTPAAERVPFLTDRPLSARSEKLMLKWLRKYNTWIMVVAGSLLMVTFLLVEALQGLGQGSPRTAVLVVDGEKISAEKLDKARLEYAAVGEASGLSSGGLRGFGIEDGTHWLLLTREAEAAGLVGGPADGERFIPVLAQQIVQARAFMMRDAAQMQQMLETQRTIIENAVEQVAGGPSRLDRDQVLTGLSKLQGVFRLRRSYQRVPRLSDRRLVSEFRELEDSAAVDYVFVPAERELRNVERPTDAQIAAHFEQYKDVKASDAAESDQSDEQLKDNPFGFGYRLADRLKLEYLIVSRKAAESAVSPDLVEVQKRFRRKYPDAQMPEGVTADQELALIEAEVKAEQADRVMRAAEQAIRAEFDRALRNLPQSGVYRRLPEDWSQSRPSLPAMRDLVVTRVQESTGAKIEPPVVQIRGEWATQSDVAKLDQIGNSFVMRGPRGVPFTEIAMSVRELAGDSSIPLQVGVLGEPMTTRSGDRVFFVITDARKASPPESIDLVQTQVVSDLMRLEAFNRLSANMDELRSQAVQGGLESLSIKPEDAASMGGVVLAADLPVNKATVRRDFIGGTAPNLNDVDHPPFRNAVLESAKNLDPTKALDDASAQDRFAAAAIPASLGIGIAKITGLNPVTAERLRVQQARAVEQVTRELMGLSADNDPFSLKSLRARLKVEDLRKGDDRDQSESAEADGGSSGGSKPA